MSKPATIIRLEDARRRREHRSGRFPSRHTQRLEHVGRPTKLEPASDSGRLLRFEPRLEKDGEGLATEYALRLAPRNIARVRLRVAEDKAWIDWVFVPPSYRGKGIAGRVLREVCADADLAGVSLGLEARACAGLTQAQLEAWYGSFGFVVTGEKGEFGPVLRRPASDSGFRAA